MLININKQCYRIINVLIYNISCYTYRKPLYQYHTSTLIYNNNQQQHHNNTHLNELQHIEHLKQLCPNYICKCCITWHELNLLHKHNSITCFGRLPHVYHQYKQHVATVQLHYNTISDYIKYNYLQHCYDVISVNNKIACTLLNNIKTDFSDINDDTKLLDSLVHITKLTRNNYPYALTDDIEHLVLWCVRQLQQHEIDILMQHHRPKHMYDYIVYINPPHLMSVKQLWHAQIFAHKRHT